MPGCYRHRRARGVLLLIFHRAVMCMQTGAPGEYPDAPEFFAGEKTGLYLPVVQVSYVLPVQKAALVATYLTGQSRRLCGEGGGGKCGCKQTTHQCVEKFVHVVCVGVCGSDKKMRCREWQGAALRLGRTHGRGRLGRAHGGCLPTCRIAVLAQGFHDIRVELQHTAAADARQQLI